MPRAGTSFIGAFAIGLLPFICAAAVGDLDPDWTGPSGTDSGYSLFDIGTTSTLSQTLPAPGGGLYARISHDGGQTTIVRLTTDGSYDTSFGDNGSLLLGATGNYPQLNLGSSAMHADGNGGLYLLMTRARLIHVDADGQVDTDFGVDGISNIVNAAVGEAGYSSPTFFALEVDPTDGSLWIGGFALAFDDGDAVIDWCVARVASDGQSLVSEFDGGVWIHDVDGGADFALSLVRSGDQLLVGGQGALIDGETSTSKATLMRLDLDGTIDEDFGDAGLITESFGLPDGSASLSTFALRADGSIVIAGRVDGEAGAIAAYDAAGAPLAGFNAAAITPASVDSLIAASDGSLTLLSTGDDRAVLTRLLADGSADTAFDSDGQISLAVGDPSGRTTALTGFLDETGKLVVGGRYATDPASETAIAWLGRVLMDAGDDPPPPIDDERRISITVTGADDLPPTISTGETPTSAGPGSWIFNGLIPITLDRLISFLPTPVDG